MGHALTIALHSIDEHHQEEEEEATSITQFNEEVVYSYLFLEHLHVNCKDILNLHKHALYNQTGNYFITLLKISSTCLFIPNIFYYSIYLLYIVFRKSYYS